MKLIIDSGSTKADWAFTDGQAILKSAGMNPCFINKEQIVAIIMNTIKPFFDTSTIKEIFFYGAGCAENLQKEIVQDSFISVFSNAKVNVDIDTMAAVRATCGDQPGIACIIGTGSNSILFDGKSAQPNNYGLGYILADEGAGTYLGKKLITHYLYGILPKDLSEKFQKRYSLTREEAISNCYNKPNPNAWLASFAVFLSENKQHPWVLNTIANGFDEFIHLFVMNYPGYEKLPVHFIGSIAYFYQDILSTVATANKIQLGKILQKPIDGLILFHNS